METNPFAPIAAFKSPFAKLNHHEKLRNKIGHAVQINKQQDGLVMGTQPCGRQLATLGYTHKYTQPHLLPHYRGVGQYQIKQIKQIKPFLSP